jgi:hypothetical protein
MVDEENGLLAERMVISGDAKMAFDGDSTVQTLTDAVSQATGDGRLIASRTVSVSGV